MFCSKCGSLIKPGSSFCVGCGASVQPPSQQAAPQMNIPGPKAKPAGWVLWLVIGVVALAGIAAAVYFLAFANAAGSTDGSVTPSPVDSAAPSDAPAQMYDKEMFIGTWYETTGARGSITFNDDGTYTEQISGTAYYGTYEIDTMNGFLEVRPDDMAAPRVFFFEGGVLMLKDAAAKDGLFRYTRDYVEQKPGPDPTAIPTVITSAVPTTMPTTLPTASPTPRATVHLTPTTPPDYSAIVGYWYSTTDPGLSVKFRDDGTVLLIGTEGDCISYEFDPAALTGTVMIDEGSGVAYPFPFSIEGGSLHFIGDIFSRTKHPLAPIYGGWYCEGAPDLCIVFYTGGYAEFYGVAAECTGYTFDAASLTGTISLDDGGGPFSYNFSIINGKLHMLGEVYSRS